VSKTLLRILAFLALNLLPLTGWAVTNAVVGSCYPGTQFTTIQAAVNAASSGSTVRVCPGNYPEQIFITQPVSLLGISVATDAVIVPPTTGFIANGSYNSTPFVSQVLVWHTTATINNIAIDAGGSRSCLPAGRYFGIAYQSSSGTIKNSVVKNGPYCGDSSDILADTTSDLKITNNALRDASDYILVTSATNTTINNNTLIQGYGVPFWGVDVQNSPGPTTITGNTISSMQIAAINIISSPSATITGNNLPGNQFAIGIYLFAATNAIVQNNRITTVLWGIQINDNGQSGNINATKNTIMDANCGLSVGQTLNDIVSPNTVYVSGAANCL
jgi:Periplasmic copper-binding protein (NosD)